MDSDMVASWISDTSTREVFLSLFAPDATVKDQAFPLVVQFVPLHFKPERDLDLQCLEEENSLPARSIMHARWIKPAHRRAPDQTCGHAIFTLSRPEVANIVLTSSLIICQKHVYAEKCKKEPTRCLKCHRWGHLSYDCMQKFDTCGTCAGRHCTPDCMNGQWPRCVSRWLEGHASWDRRCPIFICKCEELNARLTENSMPFFPTSEAWTHVQQPPRPAFHYTQAAPIADSCPVDPQRRMYRQSMLPFLSSQQCPQDSAQPTVLSGQARGVPTTSTNGIAQGPTQQWGVWNDAPDQPDQSNQPLTSS